MAVKCNIPNLAIKSFHSISFGFSCEDVTKKIVQNYLEYLKCSEVDYSFCDDFPCIAPEGDVFCSIDDLDLTVEDITINSVTVLFTTPIHPYTVVLVKLPTTVVDTKLSPVSPVHYTGLQNNTDYKVVLTVFCPGGEIKSQEEPFTTIPTCVEIIDFEGTPENVNDL